MTEPDPAVAPAPRLRAVVLVEGESDRAAVEALAGRQGRDLAAEGVAVLAMGGAGNVGRFLARYGPRGLDVRLAGLVDAGEEPDLRRALALAGLGDGRLDREGLAALGFHVCEADLEDELIRALGVAAVERVVAAQGELRAFRTLQKQAAQRGRTPEAQLRRFLGSGSGRKVRYGRLLVEALDPARVPAPLAAVLAHV
ncbi:MAG TPA: TOPRIM nucleotidyl transferase/hydrolase domain-containing protein [Acidimicrobiales bacterium]